MFGVSLQDRLKAAVNTLEATGSSLQARALNVNANPQSSPKDPSSSRPLSPNVGKSTNNASSSSPITSPTLEKSAPSASTLSSIKINTETSPTKSTATAGGNAAGGVGAYVTSPSHLAENALSGLRKSFHFGRSSVDLTKPSTTTSPTTPQQELKDITAGPSSSRPSSPNPKLLHTNSFALGSDPSSMSATPQPRSPSQIPSSRLIPRPLSPLHLPPPDPNDPATYPLPPSPTVAAADKDTLPPPKTFLDPLGASPSLQPSVNEEPPQSALQQATPGTDEKGEGEAVGLGVKGVATEPLSDAVITTEESGEPSMGASEKEAEGKENGQSAEAESQKMLDMERRYEDLSQRFTTLLTQTHNANKVLKELTPLEGGVADHEALEGWVMMMNGKVDMITEEMKRLQNKLTLQDSRMEELRDTHRLEGSSQADLITKLRADLAEAQSKASTATTDASALTLLRTDLTKAQTHAKEEEEKRTKAISLLKTVRLKLVKVEKEREEIEKDRAEERAERSRASEEVERVKAEREREVNNLRKGFERELAGVKERYEKDLQSKKAAWELEMITTKATHAKELSARATKVNGLEAIVKELNVSKQHNFEALQSKQAEAELARAEMEAMQTRTKELEFQLREANERCALLEDSVRDQSLNGRGRLSLGFGLGGSEVSPSPSRRSSFGNAGNAGASSSTEVQRLLAESEARSEAKLSDLRSKIRSLEAERNESEEEWASKLQERVRELEKLRREVQEKEIEYADSLRGLKERERRIEQEEEKVKGLERELVKMRTRIEEGKADAAVAVEAERVAKDEVASVQIQMTNLQTQLDESKSSITHLRSLNKTLREELRKVQSSVQLMEKQRNPGVGYWSSSSGVTVATGSAGGQTPSRSAVASPSLDSPIIDGGRRKSIESTSTRGGVVTPVPGSGSGKDSPAPSNKDQDEEEVNLEYLRNVILQFLEHKEMRPNLVRVLSVILRFTPQELRRLNSKLLS
ncbi:hypothetical protein CI109_103033 [Kwoniella shandongensis]|uniref:Uncharacterized protein n=1 Tax=Kwoniella shandongensis TaxID=1734106 RepID=A0A5M6C9X0_9TREE|nr:uncharacterized protein CI109_000221 [Kwoniella shandongensis]KAA5531380.1 hypothetical protein CI109_000221 [Kwoniella shandongensis]